MLNDITARVKEPAEKPTAKAQPEPKSQSVLSGAEILISVPVRHSRPVDSKVNKVTKDNN